MDSILPCIPPVTPAEMAAFPSIHKASQAARQLYATQDYLAAYTADTDLRVQADGPEAAIGGDWEAGGQRQLAFLQAHGVLPFHHVIDFGCGTGRLARWLIPYLDAWHYYGIDISRQALHAAREQSFTDGTFATKHPCFVKGNGVVPPSLAHIEVIWAYAVFIHLPTTIIETVFANLHNNGRPPVTFDRFYFTYKPAPVPCRSGLKQFSCPLSWYQDTARRYSFEVSACHAMPYIPQPMACLTLAGHV